MSSKLVPSDPSACMVIRKVTPDITTLSVPFRRFGRINIGGRGTIVRLRTGSLAVFSPVALTQEVKSTVSNLGIVKYLIAPDAEHHIFIGQWHSAFPESHVIGPEGLPEKRAKQDVEDVPFSTLFRRNAKEQIRVDEEFDSEFEYEYVHAHPNKELVFNHKPSGTLIEADLLFNLPANEQMSKSGKSPTSGLLTKLACSLNHTRGSAIWQKRFLWYGISAGNRNDFNKSMARIDRWQFERIVPCHGDVIETDGKAIFRKVMQWHLDAAKKSS